MATTEARSGLALKFAWALGEQNWNTDMDANLKSLALFSQHLSVKTRGTATPPGSPVAYDAYIVAGSPTGAWVGHATHVAVWDGSAWVFATPRTGWLAHVEDELKITVFRAGVWSTGIAI